MQHIVINYQQRQQYLLILIVTLVFSFGLGFWFGYHSNSADELTMELSQLENQSPDDESSAPDWSDESAPDTKADADNKVDANADSRPAAIAKPAPAPAPAKPVVKPVVVAPPPPAKPAPAPVTPVVSRPAPAQPPVVTPAPAPVVTQTATVTPVPAEAITNNSLSAVAANTLFTVQAGVFENRDNAMKLVDELNTKGLDAYAEEFIASSGDIKFNVRFGRNSDRDQVQRKLARFKQIYTTSAYIIIIDK